MTLKEILNLVLLTSPLWAVPVSICIATVATREGMEGKKPIKTGLSIAAYFLLMVVLVVCWCIL